MSFLDKFLYPDKEEEKELKTKKIGEMGNTDFFIWVDLETGVEYIILESPYGVAVTPRFDSNGSIKVNK